MLLKGDEAIKIRRAIRLPFLDYSTLEKRRAAAQAEIALNRAYAPHIYIDSAPIRRTRDGYGFEGDGEIVEWATRMRRFDENATLDKVAARGELSHEVCASSRERIHAMHAQRAEARGGAGASPRCACGSSRTRQAFAEQADLFSADAAAERSPQSRARRWRALTPLLRRSAARAARCGAATAICICAISR